VNYSINRIGGVRRDLSADLEARAVEGLRHLEGRMERYARITEEEELLRVRTQGVGMLPRARVEALGAVGPTARGSGVDFDVRRDDPYLAYEEVPFRVITSSHQDVYGRLEVRVHELAESVRMALHVLEHLPSGELAVKAPRTAPPGEYVSRYEAPRGELLHYIRTSGKDRVERLAVRTPTLANWPSVVEAIQGRFLADIPVVVAAIDPCLSCTSRTTVVRPEAATATLEWDDLVAHGIRFYRERQGGSG
jgi:NADH-quinone oxidoreductase subunit D